MPLVEHVYTGGQKARAIAEQAWAGLNSPDNYAYHLRNVMQLARQLADELDADAQSRGLTVPPPSR